MKKELKYLSYVLALGLSLTALSLGGAAGCGSSGGGGGAGTDDADEVESEAVSALTSIAGVAASDDGATLILRSEQAGLKAQEVSCTESGDTISCDCAAGGSFTVTVGETSGSIDFDDCSVESGETIDGTITFSVSGESVIVNFDGLTLTDDSCGDFSIDGTATATPQSDGSVNVDLDVDVTAGSLSLSLDCTVNSNDTCPEIASACDIDEAEACEGDDFADVTCAE